MSARDNGRTGGPSGPSVVRWRIVRRSPDEIRALPPVRTKPIEFKGCGTCGWGSWGPGDPVGPQAEPSEAATEAMLDWALVSWARQHAVVEVWDFNGAP